MAMPQIDDQLVQVIIAILIVVVSVIVSIVKRADRWIQVHRFPPEMRERSKSQTGRPAPASAPPEKRERPTLQTILMREMQKALRAPEAEAEQAPVLRPAPQPRPIPVAAPRREPSSLVRPWVPSTVSPRATQAAAAPALRRRHLGHLAVLHSREDIKRAVLLQEILLPPLALRRARGSLAPLPGLEQFRRMGIRRTFAERSGPSLSP
jgi:hypothetical protein